MLSVMYVIVLCAILNRFRGGGVISYDLLGHRRFWVTPFMAAVFYVMPNTTVQDALFFGACWLLWAILPWGRWYTLGRGERHWSGTPDKFEQAIERIGDRASNPIINDHICLSIRNILALLPTLIISPWIMPVIVLGMAISYELPWRFFPDGKYKEGPTGYGEYLTGAFWGIAILLV